MVECAYGISHSSGSHFDCHCNCDGNLCLVLDSFGHDDSRVDAQRDSYCGKKLQVISMPSPFEKWWENKGYFLARDKKLLGLEGNNTIPDAVEIARLAYEEGLYTSPPPMEVIGKSLNFPTHFIHCNCSGHMLECEVYDWKDGDAGVNFSIWERGRDGKKIRTWREKLRWCWQILRTGMPWADDIIATNKDARGLANFILQNLPKEESNEETKEQ